jgi:hypothetical protein
MNDWVIQRSDSGMYWRGASEWVAEIVEARGFPSDSRAFSSFVMEGQGKGVISFNPVQRYAH